MSLVKPLVVRHRREAVEATRKMLLQNLERYLPDESYRSYYAWALSEKNPDQKLFDRIIALTQLGNLTAAMLTELPGPDDWQTLLRQAIPVNLYQIFEVISDNLGLGLADVRPDQDSPLRDLVVSFNAIAAEDLRKPAIRPAAELLSHLKKPCGEVSGFEQSLTANFHASLVSQYQKTFLSRVKLEASDLEHSVWSGLVANIESGRDVLTAIAGTAGEPEVRAKTVERYEAVDRTLTTPWLNREELVTTSTQTVLVTPTLGYFATVFGELSTPDPGYREALADGSLTMAFETASLLIRLQNDIGSSLLRMFRHDRAALLQKIEKDYGIDGPDSAIALLTRAASEPALNRFRKDLLNGEFNICLYEAYRTEGVREGFATFQSGLDYFADLYSQRSVSLQEQLITLSRRLRDHRIIEVTRRFVRFHENLYTHRYDDLAGDYAI